MSKKEEIKAALLAQYEQYPELKLQDFFKTFQKIAGISPSKYRAQYYKK